MVAVVFLAAQRLCAKCLANLQGNWSKPGRNRSHGLPRVHQAYCLVLLISQPTEGERKTAIRSVLI